MYDFKTVEKEVIKFWEKNQIYPNLKKRNSKGKKFYFLQGPPYTSGYLHAGHAWNNTMKDMVMRYHRMKGEDVWDRGGFDTHGLPTARKVMAELKFESKDDIEKYGVDKFVNKCMEYAKDKAGIMNKELWRLGVWMDHENAYMPINNSYIESIWWMIKKAHEKKRLYKGLRTLTWCSSCATAMAKHECEYKEVKDMSVFLKFKVKDKDEFFIIWTTTPWTIPFNVGIMVHPELEYLKVEVEGEKWIVAKGLAAAFIKGVVDKDYKIIEEFKGKKLEGVEYEHFWMNEIEEMKELKKVHPKIHTVVLSEEFVSLKAGSGLVHMAAGCGPEDYEVGKKNNIPPFNNLDEKGVFPKNMGRFSNWTAKKDDKKFIELMEEDGVLIAKVAVDHDYAHCERCHSPVIFRATEQWFFKTEDLKKQMLKENKNVLWVPDAGRNAFDSWLTNLRDNSITKQRYWGTPAPIWLSEDGDIIVVGSIKELEDYGCKVPKNLHKPWIDKVVIKKDGKTYKRIPDILDVWIDAGCASWACLDYPQNEKNFKKYFPADFILEAKEQVRGWFNLLMVASVLGFGKNSFKAVYMHGMLTDVDGVKMSKSIGNVIAPSEMVDKFGTDTLRFYFTRVSAGEDVNFSWDAMKMQFKNLSILWNVHKYLIDYCKTYDVKPGLDKKNLGIEEKYILSRLHSGIKEVTGHMEVYQLDKVPKIIEDLFLELSRTYIQMTREKVNDNPKLVLGVIYEVLFESIRMLSVLCPFISEKMYLNFKGAFDLKEESVHYLSWPKFDKKMINEDLEKDMKIVQDIIQSTLSAREKAQIGVRWPLAKVTVVSSDEKVKVAVDDLRSLLLSHVNIKEIEVVKKLDKGKLDISLNRNAIGKDFKKDSVEIIKKLNDKKMKELVAKGSLTIGKFKLSLDHVNVKEILPKGLVGADFSKGVVYIDVDLSEGLEKEGYAREVVRRIQDLRKKLGMVKKDRVKLTIISKYSLEEHKEDIMKRVGATTLDFSSKKYKEKEEFSVKGKKFKVELVKV